jgi:transcriptional regulator with GAF, ATPase, and Fis domain
VKLETQAKLCGPCRRRRRRVGGKENIPTDVRIVAATNRDLEEAVREGGSGRTSSTASTSSS